MRHSTSVSIPDKYATQSDNYIRTIIVAVNPLYSKARLIPIYYSNYPLFTYYLQAHSVLLGKVNVASLLRPNTFPLPQLDECIRIQLAGQDCDEERLHDHS